MSDFFELLACLVILVVALVLVVILGLACAWEIVRWFIDERGRKKECSKPPPKIF